MIKNLLKDVNIISLSKHFLGQKYSQRGGHMRYFGDKQQVPMYPILQLFSFQYLLYALWEEGNMYENYFIFNVTLYFKMIYSVYKNTRLQDKINKK